jgi:putative SOS response-associated peptidase YedK
MCGRFAATLPPEQISRLFGTRNLLLNIGPNWNTAPTQEALVVRRHPDSGERHLDALKMGAAAELDEGRGKSQAADQRPLGDGHTTPHLPGAFAKRRAIVPVEAFFEWRRPEREPKQPFAIARADGSPLALAGLWEGYRRPSGEVTGTFCILTTSSNRDMLNVHDRRGVAALAHQHGGQRRTEQCRTCGHP